MRRCATNSNSASAPVQAGFTLLELVVAITLFAFIVIHVLADREESIRMSGKARTIQTVRYLAASKIDEVRFDPERFGESDSGDFAELDPDDPTLENYSWDLEIKKVVAVGSSEDAEADYMFEDDEDTDPATDGEGNPVEPRYVRKMTLTINYAPRGEVQPDLSIRVVTYLPPGPEDEEEQ
ncbi:MAG: prepilin-type N-terminal cleavage/methylation domain-containing protein [Planctomycetota bacterium]